MRYEQSWCKRITITVATLSTGQLEAHPSVRCLIRLCTFDHEELSLETNIPVAKLFAWPSCRTHQPCSLVGFHHRSLSAHNFKLLRSACKPLESQAIENVLSPIYSRSVPASNGCGDFTPRMVQQGSTFAAFSVRRSAQAARPAQLLNAV